MTDAPKRRRSGIRRAINGLGMRGGETHESKVWAQIGKGLCAWLIWKHADVVILHYEALLVLLVILVTPDILKKMITMKYSGAQGFTEHSERSSSSVTVDRKPLKKEPK